MSHTSKCFENPPSSLLNGFTFKTLSCCFVNTTMMSLPERKIGYLMSEKKCQKLNPAAFSVLCSEHGYTLQRIDTEKPIEEQGSFAVIINKLTDIITQADAGCEKSKELIRNFESYVRLHPEVVVLDPPENVRILMNRSHYYSILQHSDLGKDIFSPTFVELNSSKAAENLEILKKAGVGFPLVCKPTVAHGKSGAHDMSIVFSENGVKDCQPPCVVQTFINHNAKLYKIFIVGKRYHVTQRPSLRNFYPNDEPSIFFNSHDVSKPKSNSHLNALSPEDAVEAEAEDLSYREDVVERIVDILRRKIGIDLMGVDIVIEKGTGRHAVIDINTFPGYECFPNFLESLMDCIIDKTATNCLTKAAGSVTKEAVGEDSGCDTDNSSDEKNKVCSSPSLNRGKKNLTRFVPRPDGSHQVSLIECFP